MLTVGESRISMNYRSGNRLPSRGLSARLLPTTYKKLTDLPAGLDAAARARRRARAARARARGCARAHRAAPGAPGRARPRTTPTPPTPPAASTRATTPTPRSALRGNQSSMYTSSTIPDTLSIFEIKLFITFDSERSCNSIRSILLHT